MGTGHKGSMGKKGDIRITFNIKTIKEPSFLKKPFKREEEWENQQIVELYERIFTFLSI